MSRRTGNDNQSDQVQYWRRSSSDDIIEEEYDFEEDDDDDVDDRTVEVDEDLRSSMTSSPSIPDSDIDFDLVYALHTFVATVEGQASVVKGDALTLLDDSNSYWWLVKVLKTGEIGYIPAENIETPFERLARLNKHRNVELTSLQANVHIIQDLPPKNTRGKSVTMSTGIAYQSHVIFFGEDADDIDEEEFQVWVEEMHDHADSDSDDDDLELTETAEDDIIEVIHENIITPEDRAELRRHLINTSQVMQDMTNNSGISSVSQENKQNTSVQTSNERTLVTPPLLNTKITPIKPTHIPISNGDVNRPTTVTPVPAKRNSLKRLFSLGKRNKNDSPLRRSVAMSIRDEDMDTNWSTYAASSIDECSQPDEMSVSSSRQNSVVSENSTQVTVLRVFAGNVNLGTNYKTVVVDSNTNAEDLIKRAISKFNIQQIEGNHVDSPTSRIEYYMSVKTLDGDEITLTPQDKPLSIFQSLTAHLTTPLPSLTHVNQLREKSSTVEVTRLGVSRAQNKVKGNFGEDSVIRFYLHKRIKRIHEHDGQIYIKVSIYADEETWMTPNKKISNRSSLIKSKKKGSDSTAGKYRERIDKLIAIKSNATVTEATIVALEKFHILNGVVDGVEDDENDRALITSLSEDLERYCMIVVRGDQETYLDPKDMLENVLESQSKHNQINGSSDTSDLRFVLKKTGKAMVTSSRSSSRQTSRIAMAQSTTQNSARDSMTYTALTNRRHSVSGEETSRLSRSQDSGSLSLNDHARNVMSKLDAALSNLERDRSDPKSKNTQLLRHPTFPLNQNQQRRPLSTASSDSKLLVDHTASYAKSNSQNIEQLFKKPQPIEKLCKISDSSPSLSFSSSPLSSSSSPASGSSLSDIFDLQEMMFLVNNGISYLESKENSQWDDSLPSLPSSSTATEPNTSQSNDNPPRNPKQDTKPTTRDFSKLDELEMELQKISAARVF